MLLHCLISALRVTIRVHFLRNPDEKAHEEIDDANQYHTDGEEIVIVQGERKRKVVSRDSFVNEHDNNANHETTDSYPHSLGTSSSGSHRMR